jgi:hypothetical protein
MSRWTEARFLMSLGSLAACAALGWTLPASADGPLFGVSGAGASSGLTRGGGGLPADESFLFQLDTTTGEVVDSIGPVLLGGEILRHITSIAFDPISGDLFAIQNTEFDSLGAMAHSARFLQIDPSNGRATQIGSDMNPDSTWNFPDMTFSANGTCYAWSEFNDDLYTVNLTTGVPTRVGESATGTSQTGLAFNHGDTLFLKNSSRLFTVNRFTGTTVLADTIPGSSTRNALEIDENGTIFTIDANRHLAIINRATNSVTSLNPASSPQLAAISFQTGPALPGVTLPAGTDATVSATLRGNASNVRLFFRRGGDAGFQQLSMSPSGLRGADFEATIPGASLTARGVQYFVQADITGGTLTAPLGAPTSAFQSIRVSVSLVPMTPLPGGQYVLAGAPIDASNPAPEAVFDELGPYKKSVWRYGTFDPASGTYQEPPGALPARPGQGFWIIAKNAASPTVSGLSTNLAGNVPIALRPGFNQIANPFSFNVDVADLIVPGGVESNFISFAGGGYVTGNTVLTAGTGYWVRNSSGTVQTLEIPPIGAGAALREARRAPSLLDEGESGWSVEVIATAGEFWDRDNRFGVRPGATSSRDAFDFADPPAPPAGYATASFLSSDGIPLLTDFQSAGGHGAQWTLTFRSDRRGEPFRIAFEPDRPLPAGWRMIAIEGHGLRETDLGASPVVSGVVVSDSFERTWTIAAGDESHLNAARTLAASGATQFILGDAVPNPVSRGAAVSIDLEVPRASRTEIRVYDVAGRIVRTLSDGMRAQGAFRITWDGKDDGGRNVAAGVYFVRGRVAEFEASRKVVVVR